MQPLRRTIQLAFTGLCIWIGIEFYLFVRSIETVGGAAVTRPPGVEGFLPISSLMSLYYYIQSGIIHPAHPAGMFILLAILAISLVFGKSFCSWLCPVGLLSEMLGNFGEKLFRQKLALPRWLDYPLRSFKYLILGFFAWAIFFAMSESALRAFLDSSYNQVADVKMYYFFAKISQFSVIVIASLTLLSIVVRNFWCRYLCPYGALLGIFSLLSPHKITRNAETCIDCSQCAGVCPSNIKIDKIGTVVSDECSTCLACLDACPVTNTLTLKSMVTKKRITKKTVATAVVIGFITITGIGVITGNWQNNISHEEYLRHQRLLESYGHPTGNAEIEELNRQAEPSTPLNETAKPVSPTGEKVGK